MTFKQGQGLAMTSLALAALPILSHVPVCVTVLLWLKAPRSSSMKLERKREPFGFSRLAEMSQVCATRKEILDFSVTLWLWPYYGPPFHTGPHTNHFVNYPMGRLGTA